MSARTDLVPAILRLALALTFIFSGLERLVRGPEYSTAYFSSLGIAAPDVTGPAVSWLEFVGGGALLVGAVTRIAAVLFAVEMLVALIAVRLPAAASAPSIVDAVTAVRLEALLLAAAVALALLGPGRWSLDHLVRRRGTQQPHDHPEDVAR